MAKKARRVAVIMAGGSGERFWPLSRAARPKQLLRLTHPEQTLLEEAVHRITPLIAAEDVFVATSRPLATAIRKAGLPIPAENVLAEPAKRNTAGCLCWVAAQLQARFPGEDPTLAILTADHLIEAPTKFRACVKTALAAAEKEGALVTIGVVPTRPETGYGYIEVDAEPAAGKAVPVARFREKPNAALAREFVASGRHFWNSGMFFWSLSSFEREMAAASPAHAEVTRAMAAALARRKAKQAEALFETLPDVSIDYALMEKAKTVRMTPSTFPWDDVGAWDALERSRKPRPDGNIVEGEAVVLDSKGCIVLNDAAAGHVAVGVVGATDLIVIVAGDAVLVVPKEKAQDVRLVARELRRLGAKQV